MRREPEYFEDLELELLYLARRLRDALRLEELLTSNGIDYLIETGKYIGGFLFRRELSGAYFYVAPERIDSARALLAANRFQPYDGK
jgi:hypothetical protein